MNPDPETRFAAVYEATSRRVYAYLRRHTDSDTAESVTCEVYVKAWRHLDHLTDNPIPWLLTVARTTLHDQYRAQARRSRLTDDFFAVSRSQSAPSPETTVLNRRAMLAALAQLSEEDREALLLVGWDGLTHEEAAAVQGCSRPAFSKRLARARHRLSELSDGDQPNRRPIPLRVQP